MSPYFQVDHFLRKVSIAWVLWELCHAVFSRPVDVYVALRYAWTVVQPLLFGIGVLPKPDDYGVCTVSSRCQKPNSCPPPTPTPPILTPHTFVFIFLSLFSFFYVVLLLDLSCHLSANGPVLLTPALPPQKELNLSVQTGFVLYGSCGATRWFSICCHMIGLLV